jgi:single-strand DNA-binding protein
MASYNKVLLMGNLTRDPELTYTPSQVAICKFGLAVNRRFRTRTGEDKEEVLFVDCTVFDKKAEVVHQYCTKGKPIFVEGQLKMDTWDDKTTGQKRSKMYVIVDNFQFLGGRDQGGGAPAYAGEDEAGGPPPGPPVQRGPAAGRPPAARPPVNRPAPQKPAPEQPFPEENQFKDDDIPF